MCSGCRGDGRQPRVDVHNMHAAWNVVLTRWPAGARGSVLSWLLPGTGLHVASASGGP